MHSEPAAEAGAARKSQAGLRQKVVLALPSNTAQRELAVGIARHRGGGRKVDAFKRVSADCVIADSKESGWISICRLDITLVTVAQLWSRTAQYTRSTIS